MHTEILSQGAEGSPLEMKTNHAMFPSPYVALCTYAVSPVVHFVARGDDEKNYGTGVIKIFNRHFGTPSLSCDLYGCLIGIIDPESLIPFL